jgi:pyruvate/2-oxoglutarate dehydrogenase complex dihydrolipoamide acyltransferase (E2) component
MLKYFNSRSVRLLLSVVIVVSLASVAATRVLYQTSIEAVVNAPRIEVEAPIDGTVGEITVLPGRTVKHGAVLMNMRHDVFSRGTVDEQSSRILVLREKVNALESQIESLRAIRDSLRGRVNEYRTATVEQLRAIAQSAEAKASERAQNLDRIVALRAADGSTPADVERARAEATIAKFDAASARAQANAAQRGVIHGAGRTGRSVLAATR